MGKAAVLEILPYGEIPLACSIIHPSEETYKNEVNTPKLIEQNYVTIRSTTSCPPDSLPLSLRQKSYVKKQTQSRRLVFAD